MTVVSQLAVVEVSLEVDQVGLGKVEEEIGGFRVEVPVAEPGAPEGVLFVDLEIGFMSIESLSSLLKVAYPDTPLFVLLKQQTVSALTTAKVIMREHTFHLKPSFLSDLSS